jgi:predicted small lipoprotein YifL
LAHSLIDHRRKMAVTLLAVAALALIATGCGRRGEPERPDAGIVTEGQAAPAEPKAATDRPFILDGLIQ